MDNLNGKYARAVVCFAIGGAVVGIPCFIVGAVCGNIRVYQNVRIQEAQAAAKVVSSNPAFRSIRVAHGSKGEAGFYGTLPSHEVYESFEAAVIDQIGRIGLQDRMAYVKVANGAARDRPDEAKPQQ
jgi:hypothetical protein